MSGTLYYKTEVMTMFDFQSAMAEGKARAQRQRVRGQTSSVRMFTSSADRWRGWTEEEWQAMEQDAAIDDAEAYEWIDDADAWQCESDVAGDVDAPPAGEEHETEGKRAPALKRKTLQHGMTARQYAAALKKLGVTPHTARNMLGISSASSYGYAGGSRPIPPTVALLVRALVKLSES